MNSYQSLWRLKDRIKEDYLADPHSAIYFLVRIRVGDQIFEPPRPLDPGQVEAPTLAIEEYGGGRSSVRPDGRGVDVLNGRTSLGHAGECTSTFVALTSIEMAAGFGVVSQVQQETEESEFREGLIDLVRRIGIGSGAWIEKLPSREPSGLNEYFLCSRDAENPMRRFLSQLKVLDRFLMKCRTLEESIDFPDHLLIYALSMAARDPLNFNLSAECFQLPQAGEKTLRPQPLDLDCAGFTCPRVQEMGVAKGDYLLVLEGDARIAVVECMEVLLDRVQGSGCQGMDSRRLVDADPARPGCSAADRERLHPSNDGRLKPVWDRERKALYFGDSICREFTKRAGNQIRLLKSFQDENWPEAISDPFNLDIRMRQTVADLNRSLDENVSPVRFRIIGGRVNWYLRGVES